MTVEKIGDKFLEEIRVFYDINEDSPPENHFTYFCSDRNLEVDICYSIQGSQSMTIEYVNCFSAEELAHLENNKDFRDEHVTPKGIFTKIVQYVLWKLNNPPFRVFLLNVVYPEWFEKLRQRGWKSIFEKNQARNFYDCYDTSLYISLETCIN